MERKIIKRNKRVKKKLVRLLPSYALKTLLKKDFPHWAYIYITRKCNESCDYCSYTGDSPEMSEQELISAIDKVHELGTRYVSFFGGEPTLRRRKLVRAIKHASLEKRMFTQLPTNASLLDGDYLDELGSAGLDMIDVSFDSLQNAAGSRKNLHNNSDIFKEILKSRDKYGFQFKTNQVITRNNYEEIDKIFEFAKENNIALSLRLAFSPPLKERSSAKIYFQNTPEDIKIVEDISKNLINKKKQGYLTSEPIEFYEAMPSFVKQEENIWKCNALRNNITIETNGLVRLCGALSFGQGNLEIHFSELTTKNYKKLNDKAKAFLPICNDNCLAAAYFCSDFYLKNPITFLKDAAFKAP